MEALTAALADLEAFLIAAVASPWMPVALVMACAVDSYFAPVPSETVIIAAATLSWSTAPEVIVVVVLAATAGAWMGDNSVYAVGRRLGRRVLDGSNPGRIARIVAPVRTQFERRPESILFTARFIPGARVAANLLAGASRIAYPRYIVVSLVNAATWASVLALIAVAVGSVVPLEPLALTALTTAIALVGGFAADRIIAARRARSGGRRDRKAAPHRRAVGEAAHERRADEAPTS